MFLQVGINKIYLSDNEAEAVKKAWVGGMKKIMIKGEIVNSEYIVGVFDGDDPNYEPLIDAETRPNRLIEWQKAKTDWEQVGNVLAGVKTELTKRGVFKQDPIKERYLENCRKKDEQEKKTAQKIEGTNWSKAI